MLDCISVENMRRSDAYTIENFVPSLELMHRAAYGVYLAAQDWSGKTAIVTGSGNNGGDGFALSCILKEQGFDCTVFTLSSRLSGDSAFYAEKARVLGVPVLPFETGCLEGFRTVVDCLLGTGFQGAVRDNYRTAIHQINRSGAAVVSVDINSGMNGDTGEGECIVDSALTVTIGFVKRGLVANNAGNHMKKLVCADIGIRLLEHEQMLCSHDEMAEAGEAAIPCPRWLDMDIIRAVPRQ